MFRRIELKSILKNDFQNKIAYDSFRGLKFRPQKMFPVVKGLTLFGFTLWLMPYVSPGWRGPVMGALSTPKFHLSIVSLIKQ